MNQNLLQDIFINLSTLFNNFYEDSPILKEEEGIKKLLELKYFILLF